MRRWLVPAIVLAVAPAASADPPRPAAAAPRVDANGERLPHGAVARFGSAAFRHGNAPQLRFTPDGKGLVTWQPDDQTFRLWDVATGRERGRLDSPATQAGVAPDGGLVLRENDRVAVWAAGAAAARKAPGELGETAAVDVEVSPDGRTAAVETETAVILFDLPTGRPGRTLKLPANTTPAGFAFSPDGRWLAGVGATGNGGAGGVSLWDIGSGKRVRTYRLTGEKPRLAFHPDGSRLAVVTTDGLTVYDTASDEEDDGFAHPELTEPLVDVAFAADGKALVGVSAGGLVTRLDPKTGAVVAQHRTVPDPALKDAVLAPGGAVVAATDESGGVHVWDAASYRPHGPPRVPPLLKVRVAPDGRTAECLDSDLKHVYRWDSATGRPGPTRDITVAVDAVAWRPGSDKAAVVTGGEAVAVVALDLASGVQGPPFAIPAEAGTPAVALSRAAPDRAAVAWPGRVVLVDLKGGKVIRSFDAADAANVVAFSADGRLVAGCTPNDVVVWETATGRRRFVVRFDKTTPDGLWVSPDGRFLLIGDNEQTLHLFDLRTGTVVRRMPNVPQSPVVAFAPDGRRFAVGGENGEAWVVDTRTGETTFTARGHDGAVTGVAFTPDGSRLVTCSDDGTALVWDPSIGPETAPGPPPVAGPDEAFKLLADGDPTAAQRGMAFLYAHPADAVALLAEKVPVPDAVRPADVDRWVADLDGADYPTRSAAAASLERAGGAAAAALAKAAEHSPSAEVRRTAGALLAKLDAPPSKPDDLRGLRAVEVLEGIGSPAARAVLEKWAAGQPGRRLTSEATAARARLGPAR